MLCALFEEDMTVPSNKSEENNLSAHQDSAQAPVLTCTSEREGESVCEDIRHPTAIVRSPQAVCAAAAGGCVLMYTCRLQMFSF